MTIYIYNEDTRELVEAVTGEDQKVLEAYAADMYYEHGYAATFTPAFGTVGGLVRKGGA